jgi:limonene-1,2-epoxide hydrolase
MRVSAAGCHFANAGKRGMPNRHPAFRFWLLQVRPYACEVRDGTKWRPAMTDRNAQIALDFMDCWRRLDLEDAVSRIATDAAFTPDLKTEPVIGHEAIRALWASYMARMKAYSMEVGSVVGSGAVVFLERVERIVAVDGYEMSLPIVGVFEIDAAGKITAWRDYWDTSMARSH